MLADWSIEVGSLVFFILYGFIFLWTDLLFAMGWQMIRTQAKQKPASKRSSSNLINPTFVISAQIN